MDRTNLQRVAASYRLFPRLAATSKSRQANRSNRAASKPQPIVVVSKQSRESERAEVRARLYRMIVENERVRRNEKQPSHS